ncbi:MAG: cobyric acid synthase CobQ, partial [Clostridia bacterium]|nr:cobyric acid synthase CobQ [Clostridia bacterium]
MLGEELADPDGVEAETPSTVRGLGLLPLRTVFAKEKTRTRVQADVRFRSDTVSVDGYEIHNGTTETTDGSGASPELLSSKNNVFGTYLHGLFDSGELTEALAKWLCERRGIAYEAIQPKTHDERQEEELTRLASAVREALDMDAVYRILKGN